MSNMFIYYMPMSIINFKINISENRNLSTGRNVSLVEDATLITG